MSGPIDFIVSKEDLRTYKSVPGQMPGIELNPGQVQLRIQKFAFTANNVTYAVYGEAIGYWKFFPTEVAGWGKVPVWGFAEVIDSANGAIHPGQRFYGFLPMSSYVTMDAKENSSGFRDVAPHRLALPSAYNHYALTTSDPIYDANYENEQMILRPLFVTSFLANDFLEENSHFGARTIIVSSASSKTAYALAFLASRSRPKVDVVGLTSPRNLTFTEGLGCYDRVVTYDEVASVSSVLPVVYVDIAGSVPVRAALAQHFGDDLSYSMALGDTHWQEDKAHAALTGSQECFFAPTWLKKRVGDWGMEGYLQRLAGAWRTFSPSLGGWMKVIEETGHAAVERVYLEHLEGKADPATGNVLSLS